MGNEENKPQLNAQVFAEIAKDYLAVPPHFFEPERPLGVALHLFQPLNGNLVRFKEKGTYLSQEDCKSLKALPKGRILVLRAEHQSLLSNAKSRLTEELKKDKVDVVVLQEGASQILGALDVNPKEVLKMLPTVVEEILHNLKRTPSLQVYEDVMKKFKRATDPLTNHDNQVSALGALITLTLGIGNEVELSDIAAAGLLHDLGLSMGAQQVQMKYLIGREAELSSSEKMSYLRHPELTLKVLKDHSINPSPGALKIIEQHHETFDGTGFRGLIKSQIYFPARVLRVANDLVQLLENPNIPPELKDVPPFKIAVAQLNQRNQASLCYDPDVIFTLSMRVLHSSPNDILTT